ncbi:hypothetical protein HJG54_15320 [Leptolyngbya sp. NK1-12]|uniref:PEP-CTERM sorting domain-containing protein n=1 Tax=Leptolyngbya sp. NK1-12 TaxID=2547451 RepID=A0AA96WGB9_9CYAN|nr:hypothetical protein [Leptolyngbya sp. NK1-12]MBF2048792.1 hypothetical protein [Elainella sp. C42_A2020_010]WNZ24095.1 hypothetical protein HJG54_15320 [Leptolyngbya sp. NK1-12]
MKTSLLTGLLSLSLSVIGSTVLASISPAQAASLSFDQSKLKLFDDSTPVNFNITLDDLDSSGKVQFKVDVAEGFFADIRGIFFNIKDESLLDGLTITGGSYITQVVKQANSVLDLGGGGNLNGGGSGSSGGKGGGDKGGKGGGKPQSNSDGQSAGLTSGANGFDVGIEIGTQGTGKDDIRSAIFTISHATQKLSLSDFAEQGFGIRMMSVGTSANNREGSSKFTGIAPSITMPKPAEPEPTPAADNPEPTPEQPTPPMADNPEPAPQEPDIKLPPVAVTPPVEKPVEEPVEVPEPSTALLALGGVATLKLLKRKQANQ